MPEVGILAGPRLRCQHSADRVAPIGQAAGVLWLLVGQRSEALHLRGLAVSTQLCLPDASMFLAHRWAQATSSNTGERSAQAGTVVRLQRHLSVAAHRPL